ncbi:MAG TPA: universal stress protein [Candidatus Binataceae bacterium]|nr:universal stress protein [Candidatus Binataceae bacterium]
MVKIASVLFPTDFSEDAAYALPYARDFAEKFGAKLLILHVITNPISRIYGEPHGDFLAMEANARSKSREMMSKYDSVLKDFPNHELIISEGDAAEKILEVVKSRGIEGIVLGSHGGGALRHLLMGSTTHRLLTSVHCPVLVVRHPDRPSATK